MYLVLAFPDQIFLTLLMVEEADSNSKVEDISLCSTSMALEDLCGYTETQQRKTYYIVMGIAAQET